MLKNTRVGKCPHTNKEVLQEKIINFPLNNGWLCLHNEDEKDDAIEVAKFKKELLSK